MAATYTQANRLIAIDTPLGKDVLLLRGFSGQEAISRLFTLELDLLSTDPDIKFEDIIGKRASIRVTLGKDKERYFNGFITRFMQTGSDRGLANYRATMVPWLWFLSRTADCRIFQNKSVPDIIQQIFKELGFHDVKTAFNKKEKYEPDDYCVQYRETDFNFVSRLMEQYGIFYFFKHEQDKHTLIMADDPSACQPCPEQPAAKWEPQGSAALAEDVITSLQCERTFRCGKYAVTDYNFETPSTSLLAETKTTIQVGGNGKYEIYDYPGEYLKKAEGERLAKVRMEEEEAQHCVVSGSSSCRAFCSGYRFDLKEYIRQDMNTAYLLTSVQHSASVGSTYTTGGAGEEDYSNSFTCIPHKVPFRPPQITPKPMVQGPQTAVVVGPKGEEIYTDKYGRVKVQFHWDREGKKDEKSSCWIRVAQNWAGKQWGVVFNPRIGQEVIVEFLEGDPDQPIITGRVYNAEQMPPYALPADQTKSTIKSNSSKGRSGSNELRFEDKTGGEEIYIHGQKDWTIAIENDKNQNVGHDETLSVTNNRTKAVGVDQSETIGSNKTIKVGSNHTETIGANMMLTVAGNQTETVVGNQTETVKMASAETIALAKALSIGAAYQISVGAAMNETVAGAKAEEIGGAKTVVVGALSSEKIGANKSVDAGGSITEKANKDVGITGDNNVTASAGKNMTLNAGDQITIKTGSASITMKSNGDITINGNNISIKGSGTITMKGQKIVEN
jgi:type VI secretion system secreted protein VgrG